MQLELYVVLSAHGYESLGAKQAANVKNLMESAGFTMERALDSLKIQGEEREAIIQLLQK